MASYDGYLNGQTATTRELGKENLPKQVMSNHNDKSDLPWVVRIRETGAIPKQPLKTLGLITSSSLKEETPTVPKNQAMSKKKRTYEEFVESQLDNSIIANVPDLDRTATDIDVMFECKCCYNESPFDYMVQCLEGHLFCCQCLERFAQEAVYGHGKGELKCMKGGCESSFPTSQLERALPQTLYSKYEERMASECVNVAGLENFVRCKFCNYGAILDPDEMYFKCLQCHKYFCRHCEELFQDHQGLTCNQVEKDDETKLRIQFEEQMTEAKIRTCPSCKSRFTKSSGCNKMTCRCGTTMCYICREPNINYLHFSALPKVGPVNARRCFAGSNAEEDDRMAIHEIKNAAKAAREREGYVMERQIGPAVSPPKRARNRQVQQFPNQARNIPHNNYFIGQAYPLNIAQNNPAYPGIAGNLQPQQIDIANAPANVPRMLHWLPNGQYAYNVPQIPDAGVNFPFNHGLVRPAFPQVRAPQVPPPNHQAVPWQSRFTRTPGNPTKFRGPQRPWK